MTLKQKKTKISLVTMLLDVTFGIHRLNSSRRVIFDGQKGCDVLTQIQNEYWKNQETKRHNVASEAQAVNELAETNRHNLAFETETNRHNLAFEAETNRHNVRTEAQTDQSLAETARHNMSTERETQRSHLVDEGERRRHNKASEKLDKSRNSETARANRARERIDSKKVKESKRHNIADERISRTKVASEVALNASKTAAQDWVNQWRVDNPTLATMEQVGLKSKDIGLVLAAQGTKTITNKTLPEVADDFKSRVKSGVNDYVGWWTYIMSKPSVSAEDWAGDFNSYWTIITESSAWKKLKPDAKVKSAAKKAAKSVWDKTHK